MDAIQKLVYGVPPTGQDLTDFDDCTLKQAYN